MAGDEQQECKQRLSVPAFFRRRIPRRGRLSLPLLAILVAYAFFDYVLLRVLHSGADWAPVWVAGRLAWSHVLRAYDFSYVTSLQWPLLGHSGPRPFAYPPTSLIFFAPLGLLPFRISFAAFVAAALLLVGWVSSRLNAKPVLVWMAPPVVLAAIAGQPTLAVAVLVVASLLDLPSHERRAGLLLGLAAALKPPLLLLAPFGLIGGKHWRALETAGLTVVGFAAASVLLFGIEAWQVWFVDLPKFQAIVIGEAPLLRNTVTPYAAVLRLGFDPRWTIPAFAMLAIPLVMLAFGRSRDASLRLIMLLGGALLISPYGMYYELALLAPAVAAMPLRKPQDAIIPVIWATSLFVNASVIGLLVVYCWAAAKLFPSMRSLLAKQLAPASSSSGRSAGA